MPPDCTVHDLDALIQDYGDTALLLDSLDLLISVDTAVAHLAGALGKPVWLLLPEVPDWRWGVGRRDHALVCGSSAKLGEGIGRG